MNILELKQLERCYGKTKVLRGLNMNVPKGKIYGFLGRNGAGKTTTIKIILGLIKHHGGCIIVDGKHALSSKKFFLGRIGSIVEFPGFYPNLSGYENLEVFATLYGAEKNQINEVLDTVGLGNTGKKNVGSYSLGMKQRLGIARALLNDPDILILDEPTNGLDPSGIREIRKLLKSLSNDYGKTILLSSHILSEIEQIVDVVGMIKNGKMLEEVTIDEIRKKCHRDLLVRVNKQNEAIGFLDREKDIKCFTKGDDILIKENVNLGLVNKLLVENGFIVSILKPERQSLEEYFLNITK